MSSAALRRTTARLLEQIRTDPAEAKLELAIRRDKRRITCEEARNNYALQLPGMLFLCAGHAQLRHVLSSCTVSTSRALCSQVRAVN